MYNVIDISQNAVSVVTPADLTTSFNVTVQNGTNEATRIQDTQMPAITVARVVGVDTLTTMEAASISAATDYCNAKYNV